MTRFVKAALFLFIMSTLTIGAVRAESTVLITGSNRGIGLELARQYADLGYKVIATARTPDKADDLKELAASNPNVIIEQLDVTDHAQIDALAEKYKGQAVRTAGKNLAKSITTRFLTAPKRTLKHECTKVR